MLISEFNVFFSRKEELKGFLDNKTNNKDKELEFKLESKGFFTKLKKINKVYILLILNN